MQDGTGYTPVQIRQWAKPEHQRRLQLWLEQQEALRLQRHRKVWKRFGTNDTGCRMTKSGGKKTTRPDYFSCFYPGLSAWARTQRNMGHDLSGTDLLGEYQSLLEDEDWRLQELEESEGQLSTATSKWQALVRKRLAALGTKSGSKTYKARLKVMTGFSEQKPGLVSPLTPQETATICSLTWQGWDFILNKVFTASAEELSEHILDAHDWVRHRASIPLVFWDAVPVYLDPSAGSVLVPLESLEEARLRRLARQALKKELQGQKLPGCVELRPGGDAMGATRRDKNRLTLILRQIIEGVFDLPAGQLPQGKHLPSLLLVQASQPCFLADMSVEEPSVWLRSHKVIAKGVELERVEGERVGALMSTWRELRRAEPYLFRGGVLVGGLIAGGGGEAATRAS